MRGSGILPADLSSGASPACLTFTTSTRSTRYGRALQNTHNSMPFKSFGRSAPRADTFADAANRSADKSNAPNSKPGKRRPRKPKTITPDPRRTGRLSDSEKSIITAVIADTPGDITPAQQDALAIALKRKPDAIADAVVEARERLQANLGRYVDIHLQAAENALSDDPDVARKAAEFMIEKVSAKRRDGKVERLIDAPTSDNQGPRIQIGIALGGMPGSAGATTIDSQ